MFSLKVILSSVGFCLIFFQFQSGTGYKKVVYKKSVSCMVLFPYCPSDISLYVVLKSLRGSRIIKQQ